MKKNQQLTTKAATTSKTLRLKQDVVDSIETLAEDNNRNFNNMAETLMRLGMKHYQGLGLSS
ncbi:hypothetical protein [Aestuariibaculum marinum]|uniref:Uncharacterized protein n=1 Tax=Aestuariibaculum marinum TaxID=2683592 RepID=A0A8J6PNZ2_9FLAO|nr:hypothetical protein [Aestuariibaculum marinum]MBD0822665.1 hypothetical protein [Aestuariibaculum marinum]